MKEIIKKQKERIENSIFLKQWTSNKGSNDELIQHIEFEMSEIRKEWIEYICDKMIGKKEEIKGSMLQAFKQIVDQRANIGYNCRIKEEEDIKQLMLKNYGKTNE